MANIPKAQPRPLSQAYLILSDKKTEFGDRIALVDLFFPDTKITIQGGQELTANQYKIRVAQLMWETLMEKGFRLNHNLEHKYEKQQSCIWCGGVILTYGNEDKDNPSWETRCSDCNYLYDEN